MDRGKRSSETYNDHVHDEDCNHIAYLLETSSAQEENQIENESIVGNKTEGVCSVSGIKRHNPRHSPDKKRKKAKSDSSKSSNVESSPDFIEIIDLTETELESTPISSKKTKDSQRQLLRQPVLNGNIKIEFDRRARDRFETSTANKETSTNEIHIAGVCNSTASTLAINSNQITISNSSATSTGSNSSSSSTTTSGNKEALEGNKSEINLECAHPTKHFTDDYRQKKKFVDLVFYAEPELNSENVMISKEIYGHRLVLESIPFVKKQLTENYLDVIDIPDLDGSAVEAIVRSYYTQELNINYSNLKNILAVADKFEILDAINLWKIKSMAESKKYRYIYRNVDELILKSFAQRNGEHGFYSLELKKVCELVEKGKLLKLPQLDFLTGILNWISFNYEERKQHLYYLFQQVDLIEIFRTSPFDLQQAFGPGSILSSDEDCVRLHEKTAVHLLYEKLDLEKKYSRTKMEPKPKLNVKMEQEQDQEILGFHQSDFYENVTNHELPSSSSSLSSDIFAIPESIIEATSNQISVQTPPPKNQLLLYQVPVTRTRYLEAYDFANNRVHRLHRVTKVRDFSSLINVGDSIYEIGGSEDGVNHTIWDDDITSTSFVTIYRKGDYEFSKDGSLLRKSRRMFTTVMANDVLYAIGGDSQGDDGTYITCSVEELDLGQCQRRKDWKTSWALKMPRSCHASAVLNNIIYVAGGVGSETCEKNYPDICSTSLKDVEAFDITNLVPNNIRPMLTGRRCFRLHVLSGRLYAIGGEADWPKIPDSRMRDAAPVKRLANVEMFDPDEGEWKEVASMNYGRSCFGVVEVSGLLYVAGGNSDNRKELTAEYYDPVQDVWTEIPWPDQLSKFGRFISSSTLSSDYVKA